MKGLSRDNAFVNPGKEKNMYTKYYTFPSFFFFFSFFAQVPVLSVLININKARGGGTEIDRFRQYIHLNIRGIATKQYSSSALIHLKPENELRLT